MQQELQKALELVAAARGDIAHHEASRLDYKTPRERFEREQIAEANLRDARKRHADAVDYARHCGASERDIEQIDKYAAMR